MVNKIGTRNTHDMENIAHNFASVPRTEDVKLKVENISCEINNFEHLLLSKETTQGLLKCGFNYLTPIQLKSIPIGRLGLDLILQSKAGTGKTCVFAVIALELVEISVKAPQVLIMVPTKEIAFQIKSAIKAIGQGFDNLKIACMVGGFKINANNATPHHILELYKSHVIIGTPSRLKHLIYLKMINVQEVKLLVMDEVDQLFRVKDNEEMINWIISTLPKTKQVITTSATYSDELIKLFNSKYMQDPQIIRIEKDNIQLLGVKQYVLHVKAAHKSCCPEEVKTPSVYGQKISLLKAFLQHVSFKRCFVFCSYNRDLQAIASDLTAVDLGARYLCSKQTIHKRLETLKHFRDDKFKILVTTDLMSRGIDVKDVDLVVNFELPFSPDTYIHRIGRCGRFGTYGVALTMISSPTDRYLFNTYVIMYDLNVAILPTPFTQHLPKDFVISQESYFNLSPPEPYERLGSKESAYQDYDFMLNLGHDTLLTPFKKGDEFIDNMAKNHESDTVTNLLHLFDNIFLMHNGQKKNMPGKRISKTRAIKAKPERCTNEVLIDESIEPLGGVEVKAHRQLICYEEVPLSLDSFEEPYHLKDKPSKKPYNIVGNKFTNKIVQGLEGCEVIVAPKLSLDPKGSEIWDKDGVPKLINQALENETLLCSETYRDDKKPLLRNDDTLNAASIALETCSPTIPHQPPHNIIITQPNDVFNIETRANTISNSIIIKSILVVILSSHKQSSSAINLKCLPQTSIKSGDLPKSNLLQNDYSATTKHKREPIRTTSPNLQVRPTQVETQTSLSNGTNVSTTDTEIESSHNRINQKKHKQRCHLDPEIEPHQAKLFARTFLAWEELMVKPRYLVSSDLVRRKARPKSQHRSNIWFNLPPPTFLFPNPISKL